MFRLRNVALLATLVCVIACEKHCQADDINCLQYPIYEDDSTSPPSYLYVADQYPDNSSCSQFDGEVYIWVQSASPTGYQTCGSCTYGAALRAIGAAADGPLPNPVPATFEFGKTYNKKKIDVVGTLTDPSNGISETDAARIVNVKTADGGQIKVALFKATLDYRRAGITDPTLWPNKTRFRHIRVGLQITGATALPEVYQPKQIGTMTQMGIIEVKEGGDDVTYRIVTKAALFN